MSDYITVAKVGDIPDQEGRAFKVGEVMVAVFRDGDDYRAIDDMCPHAGASLASGFYNNRSVTCPWHAWRFDVCDGRFLDIPRLKIKVYEVQVVGDEIQVSRLPKSDIQGPAAESKRAPNEDEGSSQVNPNG